MATTTIPWGDGSGDNIYLTYPSASGNQTVEVTSDANTGFPRSKDVTFATDVGSSTKTLSVRQSEGEVLKTLKVNLSSIDSDHQYAGIGSSSQAYGDITNTNACGVTLTKGAGAETWIYFKFDTSSIPANANIISVSCRAKVGTTASTTYASRGCVMCSGTTVKTESVTLSSTGTIRTFDTGTWTREEINDVRIKMYATRTSTNVNTNYYLRMYGAELTIVYTTVSALKGTLSVHPSSYDTTDYSYQRLEDASNAYDDGTANDYALMGFVRNVANAQSYVYFKFNTSSLPRDSIVYSVSCSVRAYTNNSTNVPVNECQLFSGTTPKGTAKAIPTNTTAFSLDVGTWTREELSDVRLRLYSERDDSHLTQDYYFRLYGATLTVDYVTKGNTQ